MFIDFLCIASLISADDYSYLPSSNLPIRVRNKFVSQVKNSYVLKLFCISPQKPIVKFLGIVEANWYYIDTLKLATYYIMEI